MPPPSPQEVTRLLLAWSQGEQAALEQLAPLVYGELRPLAERYMARERPGHILQATALVNEAYLRLIDTRHLRWQNRAPFFGVAAKLMRRILVDWDCCRPYLKRCGEAQQVSLEEALTLSREPERNLVALDDTLQALAAVAPSKSQVAELCFFGGLSVEETAEVLKVSPDTVLREMKKGSGE